MICFLLFLVCSSPMEKAEARNVVVTSENVFGSGVVLETGLILTNYHLVDFDVAVNGKPAKILALDKDHDLALLKAPTGKFPKVKTAEAKKTERVFYVGNPLAHVNSISQGHVVNLDSDVILTDTIPAGGMSGGGLYNHKGQLIGLDVTLHGDASGYYLAGHVPIAVIRKFLADNSY